jgi:PD-(D/E)XK nuclease superfamily protein
MGRPAQGYRNHAGDRIPGTTTIIGRFKESGGLLQWAFKQGQSGIANLYDKRDEAGLAGNIAHDMIEAFILGKPQPVESAAKATPDILEKASNAFAQFCEWQEQTKIEVVATERSYVSEKYQFGGTVDAIGKDARGRTVLVDWKTGANVYTDFLIQLAAYQILLEECSEWRPEGFHLLRVAKESADFAHHYYGDVNDGKRAFILMRELYDIDLKLKKRV